MGKLQNSCCIRVFVVNNYGKFQLHTRTWGKLRMLLGSGIHFHTHKNWDFPPPNTLEQWFLSSRDFVPLLPRGLLEVSGVILYFRIGVGVAVIIQWASRAAKHPTMQRTTP